MSALPLIVRPRIASVVGVIWLFLGIAWAVLSLSVGSVWIWMWSQLPPSLHLPEQAPRFEWLLVCYAGSVAFLGGFGAHSAWLLLRLDPRSVTRLKLANYGVVALVAAFTLFVHVLTTPSRFGSYGERYVHDMMTLASLLIGAVTTIPFLVMARKLGRSQELRSALISKAMRSEAAAAGRGGTTAP